LRGDGIAFCGDGAALSGDAAVFRGDFRGLTNFYKIQKLNNSSPNVKMYIIKEVI